MALPASSSDPSPTRLRSCLSPTRARTASPTSFERDPYPPSSSNSRSTSFSSCSSEGWNKRTKCVRWQEMNGCAVTSTHHTYSQEEYDRTPLEPPSVAERDCVLPERGSRCLSAFRDCFFSDLTDDDEDVPSTVTDEISTESLFLHTPPPTEENSDDEDEGQEDKEWEECMRRRTMMFASMCPRQAGGDDDAEGRRHPQFEGYRSISSTLAELLRSVGCAEDELPPSTPAATPDETEAVFAPNSASGSGLTLRHLAYHQGEVDQVDTPSLVSSADSETELSIASPGGEYNTSELLPTVGAPPSPTPATAPMFWLGKSIHVTFDHSQESDEATGGRGRDRVDIQGRIV